MYRFCFVLLCIWGEFSKYKPPGAYFWRGDLTEGFWRYRFGGLIFGGAYTWRVIFRILGSTLVLTVRRYLQRANMDN